MLPFTRKHVAPLLTFIVSVALTAISDQVVHASAEMSFVVFATGSVVTVALGLLEASIDSEFVALNASLDSRLSHRLDLYRLLDGIHDDELVDEVLCLAQMLRAGEIPSHIAATRVPKLYERATSSIYASNWSPDLEALRRWQTTPRLRRIVAVSRTLADRNVKLTRTFILRRADVLDETGTWRAAALATLKAQEDAGIRVRVIWLEDLKSENLPPRSTLTRNFTLFDNVEGLETTEVQSLHRSPSDKLAELRQTRDEQLKYSLPLDEVLAAMSSRP